MIEPSGPIASPIAGPPTGPLASVVVRRIAINEDAAYRAIRLESLRAHPEAFSASFELEAEHSLPFFTERLSSNVIFGGFVNQTLLGTAGFRISPGAKLAHKGLFWGMYVRPAARGTGLATRLVRAVLDYAQGRVERVHLMVVADNAAARRLYQSMGFKAYATEERSLRVGDRYLDEVMMVRVMD